jgi:hypothetical protein
MGGSEAGRMMSLKPLYRGRWEVGRRLYSKRAIRDVIPIPDSPIIPTWRVVRDIKYRVERESERERLRESVVQRNGRKQTMLRESMRGKILSVRMSAVPQG